MGAAAFILIDEPLFERYAPYYRHKNQNDGESNLSLDLNLSPFYAFLAGNRVGNALTQKANGIYQKQIKINYHSVSEKILSENVKSKFRKIKKKLQLRKKKSKFEKSEYNVFFNKKEFIFYFLIKVNKGYSYSKKEKKALKDDIIFIKEILENLEEEYLLHHNDLNQEDENERIFGFTH